MGLYEKFAECYDLIYKEIVNYEKETDDLEKSLQNSARRSRNAFWTLAVVQALIRLFSQDAVTV